MREDIQHFPPPHDSASVLGHDGALTQEETEHLQKLGYVVAHWKAFSGTKLVQAYFEGLAKGLIELDPKVFKSMDTIRKQISKLDAGESQLKAEDRSEKVDVVALLKSKGATPEDDETKRRRGRPPGGAK